MMAYRDGFVIKVPGSSANLGPGFDSIGIAVTKYITLFVNYSENWEFSSVPPLTIHKEDNILRAVCMELEELWGVEAPPVHVLTMSDIPLARGLGSSAAAIVGAIEIMNVICKKNLSPDEKLQLAARFEGHADNVAASLYGGLVVSTYQQGKWEYVKLPVDNMEMVVVIPDFEAKTKESRGLLPEKLSFKEAIAGSSHANVMLAGLVLQKWELVGKMMENDVFHEPYRQQLFPDFHKLRKAAKLAGAFGVTISGAGPTVICFCEKGKGRNVLNRITSEFSSHKVEQLNISYVGSEVHSNHLSNVSSI